MFVPAPEELIGLKVDLSAKTSSLGVALCTTESLPEFSPPIPVLEIALIARLAFDFYSTSFATHLNFVSMKSSIAVSVS